MRITVNTTETFPFSPFWGGKNRSLIPRKATVALLRNNDDSVRGAESSQQNVTATRHSVNRI